MIVKYNIVITILNTLTNIKSNITKEFTGDIIIFDPLLLYNNEHILSQGLYIFDMFKDEIDAYCVAEDITKEILEIDEFEIVSLTDKVDVFFEAEQDPQDVSLRPIIKCYVHPKNDELKTPVLTGTAYNSSTIVWTWEEEDCKYSHYLVEEVIDLNDNTKRDKIVAQIPFDVKNYTETNLNPDTNYTRRLINYNSEQTSQFSSACTVRTDTKEIKKELSEYKVEHKYDFTVSDEERKIIDKKLPAFHSGVGDFNDLKVYKQMDHDFYQKFKPYIEISGERLQRDKIYEQVGFNYKLCLEAKEEIEEQEGEVTFDVTAYPREWVSFKDYMWNTAPVNVKTMFMATVFLRKEAQEQETQEVEMFNFGHGQKEYEYNLREYSLIISLDCSTSQRDKVFIKKNGKKKETTRLAEMKKGAKRYIDYVHEHYEKGQGGDAQFVVIGWAGSKANHIITTKYKEAKSFIDSIKIEDGLSKVGGEYLVGHGSGGVDGTNFELGFLYAQRNLGSQLREKKAQIVFTDGFSNRDDSLNKNVLLKNDDRSDKFINNLDTRIISKLKYNTAIIFGASHKDTDPDFDGRRKSWIDDNHKLQKAIYDKIVKLQKDTGNKLQKIITHKTAKRNSEQNDYNEDKIFESLKTGGNHLLQKTWTGKYLKTGWAEQPTDTTQIGTYSIDDIKAVTIVSDVYNFEFNKDNNPVYYDRKEKRAIVSAFGILPPTKLSETSMYDLILQKAMQTDEWADGYNQTIGTVETSGGPDGFLVKGVFVYNTYNFGDEDIIFEDNWGAATWENGMEGTVNSYADIARLGTTTYGDDCYLVSKTNPNYLYIKGFTDAIIFDGTRYIRTELNAYDYPSEVLITAGNSYADKLFNRKKKTLSYQAAGGTNATSHCLDILECDRDIYFTGHILGSAGYWQTFDRIDVDVIAHNSTVYESPILNYRFNLEDPDAKTSLHEIMPSSRASDNFRHIVFLRIYYAKNVWITNNNNYVESFGNSPIANKNTPHIPFVEGLYQWTLKEWKDGKENGWFIDNYVWFLAKPMKKIQDYYDELPGKGIDSFYGLVNGRYRTDTPNQKKDLTVDTPQFNIPTTVLNKHADTIRIYCVITEFYPKTALVSYRWEHPYNHMDSITQVNGDYIYFSSDSITYKDNRYVDLISTLNLNPLEVFNHKTLEHVFEVTKPDSVNEYNKYYVNVYTDNSDVLALRYPTEIVFDEQGKANIPVAFKGVVNATSKWSPIIHNGYYYLNQHEHYAYSEFDVDANFDTISEENFEKMFGYVTFDVRMRKPAPAPEQYSVLKNTKAELIQDERKFVWENGKGLTLKPLIDGKYYKKYETYDYISPIILFKNELTSAGKLKINVEFEDGSDIIKLDIRHYIKAEKKWSDWRPFTNDTIPDVLSAAYQLKLQMQPSTRDVDHFVEDYCCCYLDWKDDGQEGLSTNIVTITDYMTTGPDKAEGVFVSKVFDYGCTSEMAFDIYSTRYKDEVKLYVAHTTNNKDSLLLENVAWHKFDKNNKYVGRYFRYKVVIPAGEKLYWLHKKLYTKLTYPLLPYIKSISMNGEFAGTSIVHDFINIESFELIKDGKEHTIFERIMDVIGSDIIKHGFTENQVERINLICNTPSIEISYDARLNDENPTVELLNTGIKAKTNKELNIITKKMPYIFTETEDGKTFVKIKGGIPQQFSPVTVEDEFGNTYLQVEHHHIKEEFKNVTKYVELGTNRYDKLTVKINNEITDKYTLRNHIVIFDEYYDNAIVNIEYDIPYSFVCKVCQDKNETWIYPFTKEGAEIPKRLKVYFETNKTNNKFIAKELSLNPIYRTDYNGFIYLTDEHNEPYSINIYCAPLRLKSGGYDKVDVIIEVLDIQNNPVISKDINIDCKFGILGVNNYATNMNNYATDMNGVVHLVYCSAYKKCMDTIKVRVFKDDNSVIENSIVIDNY